MKDSRNRIPDPTTGKRIYGTKGNKAASGMKQSRGRERGKTSWSGKERKLPDASVKD